MAVADPDISKGRDNLPHPIYLTSRLEHISY